MCHITEFVTTVEHGWTQANHVIVRRVPYMTFVSYNPNPEGRNVGDCTVRAISKATGQNWDTTYWGLCIEGNIIRDMPSANSVWGAYLRRCGYHRSLAPDDMTVLEFADVNPHGTYVLALSGHVVCLQDNVLYDTWDSSHEIVLYFWQKGKG